MNLVKPLPSREYLQECFAYDPKTGILTWRERPRSHFKWDYAYKRFLKRTAGRPAGIPTWRDSSKTDPRNIVVKLQWKGMVGMYSAHRIIFSLMGEEIPDGRLPDHKNGNPHDNRWDNLRIATHQQNCQNKRNSRKRIHDLPKGVHYTTSGKYKATIFTNGQVTRIGTYNTPEEAHQAYCARAQELHGEFHHPG